MDENTNATTDKSAQNPVQNVYPDASKGSLKDDPLVQTRPEKKFWQFWRSSDDGLRDLYLLIVGVAIFALLCAVAFFALF